MCNGSKEPSPLAEAADSFHAQGQGQEGLQVDCQVLHADLFQGRVVLQLVIAHQQRHLHLQYTTVVERHEV
jgi:hypothetical protein